MSLNEIMSVLRRVYDKYTGIRLGIAGSYVHGTQREDSDIDVVIDGDSMRVEVMEYSKNQFNADGDVLWVLQNHIVRMQSFIVPRNILRRLVMSS